MSGKIKAKDLSYDSTLPPFLQRLHAQKGGHGDADRHEQPIQRAKRAKDPNDDDGPTVVDESGETVSKEDFEKLTNPSDGVSDTANITGELDPATEPKASGALPPPNGKLQNVAEGVVQKKRKAAKIVGQDEEGEQSAATKAVKKPKKKAKPIKLAFDNDDGD
jgi:hypothetical protein